MLLHSHSLSIVPALLWKVLRCLAVRRHTWEWQWAAQGQLADTYAAQWPAQNSSRRSLDEAPPPPPPGDYPWCRPGEPCDDDPSRYPARSDNGQQPPPDDVGMHPSGASAFGIQDLMYSVWCDHTASCDQHEAIYS